MRLACRRSALDGRMLGAALFDARFVMDSRQAYRIPYKRSCRRRFDRSEQSG
jgi:hypothetical protein